MKTAALPQTALKLRQALLDSDTEANTQTLDSRAHEILISKIERQLLSIKEGFLEFDITQVFFFFFLYFFYIFYFINYYYFKFINV